MSVPFLGVTLHEWLQTNLGSWMSTHHILGLWMTQWVGLLMLLALGFAIGYVVQWIMFFAIRPKAEVTHDDWQERLLELVPRPLRFAIALLVLRIGEDQLELSADNAATLIIIIEILLIATLTWLATRALTVGGQFLEMYLTQNIQNPAERRAVHTQITVPKGILRWIIIFLGIALILLQFEVVRNIGLSLLASAGVAGIILGFAAQRTVSNIFAGLQLAIFQPIKIGDVVVVEGEWGTIEEINLTYIVVKIWDLRRLILPVNYFIDKPFENWTRRTSEVMGTVFIQTDFNVPIDDVRAELSKILDSTDLWDGKVDGLVVTALNKDSAEIRALMSAENGGKLWDLRCLVRERLLEWLQARKDMLPKSRLEVRQGDDGTMEIGTANKGKKGSKTSEE